MTLAIEPLKERFIAIGVKQLLLVGSLATGNATPESDADFVVEFQGTTKFMAFMEVAELLESAIGRPVDLTTMHSLRPEIAADLLAKARQVA